MLRKKCLNSNWSCPLVYWQIWDIVEIRKRSALYHIIEEKNCEYISCWLWKVYIGISGNVTIHKQEAKPPDEKAQIGFFDFMLSSCLNCAFHHVRRAVRDWVFFPPSVLCLLDSLLLFILCNRIPNNKSSYCSLNTHNPPPFACPTPSCHQPTVHISIVNLTPPVICSMVFVHNLISSESHGSSYNGSFLSHTSISLFLKLFGIIRKGLSIFVIHVKINVPRK